MRALLLSLLGAVLCAWKAPPGLTPEADALDVLSTALTSGKSSRLYRRLTDAGLHAPDADSFSAVMGSPS